MQIEKGVLYYDKKIADMQTRCYVVVFLLVNNRLCSSLILFSML